jgi:hypothetical protein
VITVANENFAILGLLLEMAFQAEVRVALRQHPLVHGAMWRMAAYASFANCFMFENKRPPLRGVTLEAGFIMSEEGRGAASNGLRQIGSAAFDGVAFVWVMAISAADFSFEHWMMMGQLERGPDFRVTLETSRRRPARIDDLVPLATALDVETSRAVARFAPHVLRVVALRFQARVGGSRETVRDRFVTGSALCRADKFSARNTGRRQDRVA